MTPEDRYRENAALDQELLDAEIEDGSDSLFLAFIGGVILFLAFAAFAGVGWALGFAFGVWLLVKAASK